jgi:hypothetical protein
MKVCLLIKFANCVIPMFHSLNTYILKNIYRPYRIGPDQYVRYILCVNIILLLLHNANININLPVLTSNLI